jgi:hypothetical protein
VALKGPSHTTTRFRVVVRGELEARLSTVFDCRSIESRDGVTVLIFDVRDSAHLYGILDRFRDIDIDILSAEKMA